MFKTALFDCAINEKCCSVDGGRGICPLFSSPPRGIWQIKSPYPREFAIQGQKNANARGSAREWGGGGEGLAWLMHNLFYGKQGSIRKGQSTLKILHRQWKYLVRLKNKILHRFKRCYCEKTLLRTKIRVLHLCFHVSVVVDLPTDCIISFLFLSETDVLVPVFSQPTDVVVVNFVVVLKFPFMSGNLLNITRDEYLTDQALLPYTETKGD